MKYIVTYFPHFKKNALNEIAKIDESANETKIIAREISMIESANKNLTQSYEHSPIFVRHIFPIQAQVDISGEKISDCELILDTAKKTFPLQNNMRFSVQCRIIGTKLDYTSKDVEVTVGSYYEEMGCKAIFSDYRIINENINVISVLIHENQAYLGFSTAEQNLNNHCDEYRILSRNKREISRAENKLKEAINKFNIKLSGESFALDIGASPGGWTKVLADYGFNVIAVDPGDLNPSLLEYKNIVHYKRKIEEVTFDKQFEIIVNDMNIDPQLTAQIMCGLCDHLVTGGLAVVTFKLPFANADRSISESVNIVRNKYEVVTIKNLFHNRCEVTALLKKYNN